MLNSRFAWKPLQGQFKVRRLDDGARARHQPDAGDAPLAHKLATGPTSHYLSLSALDNAASRILIDNAAVASAKHIRIQSDLDAMMKITRVCMRGFQAPELLLNQCDLKYGVSLAHHPLQGGC